jgi:hypothetical protein
VFSQDPRKTERQLGDTVPGSLDGLRLVCRWRRALGLDHVVVHAVVEMLES